MARGRPFDSWIALASVTLYTLMTLRTYIQTFFFFMAVYGFGRIHPQLDFSNTGSREPLQREKRLSSLLFESRVSVPAYISRSVSPQYASLIFVQDCFRNPFHIQNQQPAVLLWRSLQVDPWFLLYLRRPSTPFTRNLLTHLSLDAFATFQPFLCSSLTTSLYFVNTNYPPLQNVALSLPFPNPLILFHGNHPSLKQHRTI